MTDKLTPERRTQNMRAIRSKDMKPELLVRRLVHSLGYRYRLHRKDLPGKPDLVFGPRRKVIFVHGCFWHMHKCKYGKVRPKTNAAFWQKKRTGNVDRDKRNSKSLRGLGWRVLTVWECQTRNIVSLEKRLQKFLSQ